MTGRKKGVSIGAAMKQRMGDQDLPTTPEEVKPKPVPAPEPAPAKRVAAAPVVAPLEDDPLESFNTRLPRSLQRRLKIHVVTSGTKIQTVLAEALEEYLAKQSK